jgi:leucyl aminopeptidase
MRVSVSDRSPEQLSADACVVLLRGAVRGRSPLPLAEYLRASAARLINRSNEASTWLETRELPCPRVLVYVLPDAPAPTRETLGGHAGSFGHEAWTLQNRRSLRNAGAAIERACNAAGVRHAVLAAWPEDCEIELVIEGMALRAHDPRAWERSDDGPTASTVRHVSVCLPPIGR